jgi:putative colanic acid biosynthesis UDP-glucose lipid carrier transferase
MKFRTMRINSDANVLQATENDPRITRIGRFLRRSNLDELPQFFNVLAGHMSIVGPRPHMHSDCNSFSKVVSAYKFRNLVLPGITGVAQVKGFRGPAQHFESIFKRYQWDAFYVRNANFWLDLRIIRKTAAQTCIYLFQKMLPGNELEIKAELPSKLAAIRS